jgi:hypothetical protein
MLSGLEDYEYNDQVLVSLNSHLLGKSLVGKVDNLAELAATPPPKGIAPLPRMVLFDTSSELGTSLQIRILQPALRFLSR